MKRRIIAISIVLIFSVFCSCGNNDSNEDFSKNENVDGVMDAEFPFLLNLPVDDAINELESMGAEVQLLDDEQKENDDFYKKISAFGIQIPESAMVFSYNIFAIRPSCTGFLIVVDDTVAAYSGINGKDGVESTLDLLQAIGLQGIGELKNDEPMILGCRGMDANGNPWDSNTVARAIYEFEDSNLQVQFYYKGDYPKEWEKALPWMYMFVRDDLAIIEGHVEESAIMKKSMESGDDNSMKKEVVSSGEYEICPFSVEDFQGAVSRDDWRDNGVFSSYFNLVFDGNQMENSEWLYIGTTTGKLDPNPYGYDGFDIYQVNTKGVGVTWFVIPYSQYSPSPIVYQYDVSNHRMMLVFRNGELVG